MRKGSRMTPQAFSPLHSGQATAILLLSYISQISSTFSPLHSGQATAIDNSLSVASNGINLSVPSIRGKPLQFPCGDEGDGAGTTFSPLHSGQATAIYEVMEHFIPLVGHLPFAKGM